MNKIDFSHLELRGREEEFNVLRDAYSRVKDDKLASSEIIMVKGCSGTGKSSLIRKLQTYMKQTEKENGYFVSGKFDQQRTTEPYYALAAAFNELCDRILESSDKDQTKQSFMEAVGSKGKVLLDVVPKLNQLIGDIESDDKREGTASALNQLKFVFKAFVRTVCTVTQHPVVLFLDDLQWADEPSLELIKSLMNDAETTRFLFIGSYRDNEITESHPFAKHLKDMENEKHVNCVQLGNLNVESVNELISDLTELSPAKTGPLTEIVYHKTNGNIFFVLQFMRMLQDEGLLFFSLQSYEWSWNMDKIKAQTNLTDNVVDLMASKIKRMPVKTRAALKLASCLWSTFDVELLQEVLLKGRHKMEESGRTCEHIICPTDDLEALLDHAANEGLLEKLSNTRYKFAHDRIQQAAYELVPEGRQREELHHWIGGLLWEMTQSSRSEEWMYFAAAEQMNRGASLITEIDKLVELARLNLVVGLKAMSLSAFVPALGYLETGLGHLPEKIRWRDHYELTLELHNALLSMQHCCGSYEETKKIVDEIVANAKSCKDKIDCMYTMGHSLIAQQRHPEAAELCHSMLANLGERLPKRVSKATVAFECLKLSRHLRDRNDEDLLSLPLMTEEYKIAAARFYDLMYTIKSHLGLIKYAAVVAMRMMRLMLRFGVSDESPMTFALWGQVLIGEGDIKGGYRFGQLALRLTDRIDSKVAKARTVTSVAVTISHWREPLQNSLDPLLDAHKSAMLAGEITFAFSGILGYQVMYFYGGLPLQSGVEDLLAYNRQMKEYHQIMLYHAQAPVLQMMLNLMGRSKDVLTLTGEAMKQCEFEDRKKNPLELGLQAIASCRMQLAYYFDNLKLAAELSKKLQSIDQISFSASYFVCTRFMFFGLISVALARNTKKRKHAAQARKTIFDMEEKWVKRGAVNVLHKLLLLKAEYATLSRNTNTEEVREAFNKAISTARRTGFTQDEALANERAGMFFLARDDKFWASSYLSRAHELYTEWGAQAKADELEKKHGSMLLTDQEQHYASHLRGRQRFSDEPAKSHKSLDTNKLFRHSL